MITIPDDMIDRQFMETLQEAGITPAEDLFPLDASGCVVRFAVEGDRSGEKSGAYYLHGDGLPTWGVMQWGRHDGMIQATFRFDRMTAREKARLREAVRDDDTVTRQRVTPVSTRRVVTRKEQLCASLERYRHGERGDVVRLHPFFVQRFTEQSIILPDVLRLWGNDVARNAPCVETSTHRLLFPLLRVETGAFCGLQWQGDGYGPSGHWVRGFTAGTAPNGASWLIDPAGARDDVVYVCEGVATGLAVAVMQGANVRVHCALMACNIKHVCEALRRTAAGVRIVIAADNDIGTLARRGRNPGLIAAENAKHADLADDVIVPPSATGLTYNIDWYDVLLSV